MEFGGGNSAHLVGLWGLSDPMRVLLLEQHLYALYMMWQLLTSLLMVHVRIAVLTVVCSQIWRFLLGSLRFPASCVGFLEMK